MKSFMILGSVIGFLIAAGFSLANGCPWPVVLGRACIAALAAGVLARWWSLAWISGLHDAHQKRRAVRSAYPPNPNHPANYESSHL
jgi:hypothetical protein